MYVHASTQHDTACTCHPTLYNTVHDVQLHCTTTQLLLLPPPQRPALTIQQPSNSKVYSVWNLLMHQEHIHCLSTSRACRSSWPADTYWADADATHDAAMCVQYAARPFRSLLVKGPLPSLTSLGSADVSSDPFKGSTVCATSADELLCRLLRGSLSGAFPPSAGCFAGSE
jgi:hypothetical protein